MGGGAVRQLSSPECRAEAAISCSGIMFLEAPCALSRRPLSLVEDACLHCKQGRSGFLLSSAFALIVTWIADRDTVNGVFRFVAVLTTLVLSRTLAHGVAEPMCLPRCPTRSSLCIRGMSSDPPIFRHHHIDKIQTVSSMNDFVL